MINRFFNIVISIMVITSIMLILSDVVKASEGSEGNTNHCRLSIEVNPKTKKITGTIEITTDKQSELTIYRNGARLKEFHALGLKRDIGKDAKEDPFTVQYKGPIKITYEITIENSDDNIINENDIVLKTNWYPVVDGFNTYEVRASLPKGFIAISEGDYVNMEEQKNRSVLISRLDKPYSDAITLIASKRYIVSHDILDGIDIYTYLYKEHAGQSKIFLEGTKNYLKMYQSLIGRYPYKRFSVVENTLPSAFSLPTFILMAEAYIKKDDVKETPLGHEIVHQWFGNSVFADYDKGNWHEGLTIYFADYLQEEMEGRGFNCRKRILMGYEHYVRDNNEFPLNKFTERFDYASRSIGYGKSAMVYHMLRKRFGDNIFYEAIKDFVKEHSFRVASWEDIKKIFEKKTGQDLSWFFKQWVYDTGIADIEIADIRTEKEGQGYEVSFSVVQPKKEFRLSFPVTFYFPDEKKTEILNVAEKKASFSFVFDKKPVEVVFDEAYDVFRRLYLKEAPPTIERLITDEKTIIVMPPTVSNLYTELIAAFGENGSIVHFMKGRPDVTRKYGLRGKENIATMQYSSQGMPEKREKEEWFAYKKKKDEQKLRGKDMDKEAMEAWKRKKMEMKPGFRRQCMQRSSQQIKDTELNSVSLLIIGSNNPILKRLKIESPVLDGKFNFIVKKNPLNLKKVIAIAEGNSKEEILSAQKQIPNYRKYSALSFSDGKLINKYIEKSENGIRIALIDN